MGEKREGKGPLPPVYLLIGLLLAIGLHYTLPLATIIPAPYNWTGAALLIVGIGIIASPAVAFFRAKTTIIPFQESSSLVVSGLYRYSRNPMYVGMVLILTGTAVLCGTLSPFVAPILFVPVINKMIISVEERMLERAFGDDYLEYKKRVRRWL